MTEDDAKTWVRDRFGADATDRVSAFVEMVVAETEHQNLIAPSTIPTIWERHVVDSLQLVALAGEAPGIAALHVGAAVPNPAAGRATLTVSAPASARVAVDAVDLLGRHLARLHDGDAGEIALDLEEGADMIMVKPAIAYLDVISEARRRFDVPLAAYQVSGEYAMIQAAAANGWIDLRGAALESLTSIRRAGAQIVLTYFALDVADWLA